jgi:hypothetical protein
MEKRSVYHVITCQIFLIKYVFFVKKKCQVLSIIYYIRKAWWLLYLSQLHTKEMCIFSCDIKFDQFTWRSLFIRVSFQNAQMTCIFFSIYFRFHETIYDDEPAVDLDINVLRQHASCRLNRHCICARRLTRGLYNEIYLLKFETGPDWTHPASKYASEVVTMKYVTQNTNIKVPAVYDWIVLHRIP